MPPTLGKKRSVTKLIKLEDAANEVFPEREEAIRGFMLSLLTGEHIFLVGPPGTAKSALAGFVTQHITDMEYFFYLMTKFTVPDEVFGPFDIKAFDDGKYQKITKGMFPECHIAFIDEVFKAGSSMLNCFLSCMNERMFTNCGTTYHVPLITMIGASNEIPNFSSDDENLTAMYDRFLLRYVVDYIKDESNIKKMLCGEIKHNDKAEITLNDLMEMQEFFVNKSEKMAMDLNQYLEIREKLKSDHGIIVSDRRMKACQGIIKANAVMNGNSDVEEDDLYIIKDLFWQFPEEKAKIVKTLNSIINPVIQKAAELFDSGNEVFQNFIKLVAECKNNGNEREVSQHGIEANAKLKEVLGGLKDIAREHGAKPKISDMISETDRMNKRVVEVAFNL